MKLLFLFTFDKSLTLWDNLGIIERELSLYKRLTTKGVTFKFLTYGDKKDLNYSQFLDKIEIIPVKNLIKSKFFIIKFLKSFFLPIKLKKKIIDIDIIKTNQIMGSWTVFLAKLLYKKKLVVRAGYPWFGNYISSSYIYKDKRYLRYLLNYIYIFILEFITYKLADFIIISNEFDKDYIIKTFKLNSKKKIIKVITNYVDTNLFKPVNMEIKDKHILWVGRIDKVKNLFNLLKAFKILDKFTLDLIGNGPYISKLKKIRKKLDINVNFLGLIPNDQLPYFLNKYQIFILPSYFEGNPKVLLEAMSCGIACIGTNVKGINNIIKHEENGYLCETDSKSISQSILRVYTDIQLRKRIGENARDYILKNCSLESVAEQELSLYKELLRL